MRVKFVIKLIICNANINSFGYTRAHQAGSPSTTLDQWTNEVVTNEKSAIKQLKFPNQFYSILTYCVYNRNGSVQCAVSACPTAFCMHCTCRLVCVCVLHMCLGSLSSGLFWAKLAQLPWPVAVRFVPQLQTKLTMDKTVIPSGLETISPHIGSYENRKQMQVTPSYSLIIVSNIVAL